MIQLNNTNASIVLEAHVAKEEDYDSEKIKLATSTCLQAFELVLYMLLLYDSILYIVYYTTLQCSLIMIHIL